MPGKGSGKIITPIDRAPSASKMVKKRSSKAKQSMRKKY